MQVGYISSFFILLVDPTQYSSETKDLLFILRVCVYPVINTRLPWVPARCYDYDDTSWQPIWARSQPSSVSPKDDYIAYLLI